MLKPIFTPQANIDYAESLNWYAERDVAAAERFQAAIQTAIQDICQHPDRWPKCDEYHRECIVKGFPYTIYYRVREDDLVIVAVAHHSRSPDYWRTN